MFGVLSLVEIGLAKPRIVVRMYLLHNVFYGMEMGDGGVA